MMGFKNQFLSISNNNSKKKKRTCLNEQIKMQRLDPKTIQNRTGKEYFIEHVIPPESEQGNPPNIFVIRKQNRVSTKNVEHLSSYYILNGTAFQSPNIRTVCSSTLVEFFLIINFILINSKNKKESFFISRFKFI